MSDKMDNIERLYKNYDILNDAENKSLHELEFKEILDAVTKSDKEKKLAAQFIGKFFKFFPDLIETSIDRQLDLCEDEDVQIRRSAIKELPVFCKDTKENTPKISDILAQLLNSNEPSELQIVNISLQTLSKYDPLGTAAGLFSQITSGDEQTRLKNLQYITNKFMKAGVEVFTKEVEELVITEVKKLLQDVSADEFHNCMQILSQTKLGKTVTGHAELVQLCVEQADLNAELESDTAAEDDIVECFIQCATEALPYFSSQIETTPFVKFACEKFFPLTTWGLIGAADDQAQTHLRLLKVFAELCSHCGPLETANEKIEAIFSVLLEFMPPPPMDADLNETPSFQFSHAECLMFSLHAIGKQCPDYLTFPSEPTKLKDFRSRLQYLARGTQGYIKKLQEAVKGKSDEKSEENQMKVTALKTTSNISALIRDLFHSPPSFKSVIRLSWVSPKSKNAIIVTPAAKTTEDTKTVPATGNKRHAPITFSNGKTTDDAPKPAKKAKNSNGNQDVYSPPSGKYSNKVQNYTAGRTGNGNGNSNGNRSRNNNNRFRSGGGGNKNGGGGGGGGNGNRNRAFKKRY